MSLYALHDSPADVFGSASGGAADIGRTHYPETTTGLGLSAGGPAVLSGFIADRDADRRGGGAGVVFPPVCAGGLRRLPLLSQQLFLLRLLPFAFRALCSRAGRLVRRVLGRDFRQRLSFVADGLAPARLRGVFAHCRPAPARASSPRLFRLGIRVSR